MAVVIMSIGIPGSGKSTILKKIAQWGSFEYVGPDSIRFEKYNDETDHSDDQGVWVELRSRVAEAIKSAKTIVIDSTFHTRERRAHFMEFARANGATAIEGLYFDIPPEVILARNVGRGEAGGKLASSDYIKMAYEEFQSNLPTPEEGFAALFKVNQAGEIVEIKSPSGGILSAYFSK